MTQGHGLRMAQAARKRIRLKRKPGVKWQQCGCLYAINHTLRRVQRIVRQSRARGFDRRLMRACVFQVGAVYARWPHTFALRNQILCKGYGPPRKVTLHHAVNQPDPLRR